MNIFAVIVTYNRLDLLKKCIDAVLYQTQKVKKIIVFNNSTDGTQNYLSSLHSEQIYAIHSKKNVGGAGGFFYGIS